MRHEDAKDKAKRMVRLAEILLQDGSYDEAIDSMYKAIEFFVASKETDPKLQGRDQ